MRLFSDPALTSSSSEIVVPHPTFKAGVAIWNDIAIQLPLGDGYYAIEQIPNIREYSLEVHEKCQQWWDQRKSEVRDLTCFVHDFVRRS